MIPCISFRHLQYFVAVYEEGSFTKAAERERCTQPALSAQVRNVGACWRWSFRALGSRSGPNSSGKTFLSSRDCDPPLPPHRRARYGERHAANLWYRPRRHYSIIGAGNFAIFSSSVRRKASGD